MARIVRQLEQRASNACSRHRTDDQRSRDPGDPAATNFAPLLEVRWSAPALRLGGERSPSGEEEQAADGVGGALDVCAWLVRVVDDEVDRADHRARRVPYPRHG